MSKSEYLFNEINNFKEESFIKLVKERLNKTLRFYMSSLEEKYIYDIDSMSDKDLKKLIRGLSK